MSMHTHMCIRRRKRKENGVIAPRIPGGKPYTS